jgi:hypothetical protein
LTAVFADDAIVTMGGDPPIKGGMIDGNVKKLFLKKLKCYFISIFQIDSISNYWLSLLELLLRLLGHLESRLSY